MQQNLKLHIKSRINFLEKRIQRFEQTPSFLDMPRATKSSKTTGKATAEVAKKRPTKRTKSSEISSKIEEASTEVVLETPKSEEISEAVPETTKEGPPEKKKKSNAVLNAEFQARVAEASRSKEPWKFLIHRKAQPEWIPYDPQNFRKSVEPGENQQLVKLVSWNVNGLRALVKKKGKGGESTKQLLHLDLIENREDPDVICLQETKLQVLYLCTLKECN